MSSTPTKTVIPSRTGDIDLHTVNYTGMNRPTQAVIKPVKQPNPVLFYGFLFVHNALLINVTPTNHRNV